MKIPAHICNWWTILSPQTLRLMNDYWIWDVKNVSLSKTLPQTQMKPLWDSLDLPERVLNHIPAEGRTLQLAAVRIGHHTATIFLSSCQKCAIIHWLWQAETCQTVISVVSRKVRTFTWTVLWLIHAERLWLGPSSLVTLTSAMESEIRVQKVKTLSPELMRPYLNTI